MRPTRNGRWAGRQKGLARAFVIVVLLAAFAAVLPAQQLTVVENLSIAPFSIPVPSTGSVSMGMTRVTVKPPDSWSYEISQVVVQATSSGTFQDGWVDSIDVYWEGPSGNAAYDHGALIDDQVAYTGGPYTFSGGTATITISRTVTDMPENTQTANRQLYVVYNLNSSADPTVTLGCEVTAITYHRNFLGFGDSTATVNPTAHGGTQPMDEYDTTVDAVWVPTPGTKVKANGSKVGLLRLDFDVTDATAETYVDTIKVARTFGLDSYVAAGGVLLYADDGDDVFEPDAGDGAYIASASMSAGTATLNPANQEITSAGRSFFVAVSFGTTADQRGQDFGLNIANPATDVVFADELEDDNNALVGTEFAYVPGGREYTQLGFITSTTADPPVDLANTVEIDYPDDEQTPTVLNVTPVNGATGVARAANLTVVFDEWLDESSAENAANFTLTGGPAVTATLSYDDATKTITINPDSDLVADTLYTATIKATLTDYYGTPMGADYSWSFRTVAVYPTVLNTNPANGASGVDRDAMVTATFSENVSGVNGASFTLLRGAVPVAGTVSYNDVSFTATFAPDDPLLYDTEYTATITTDVYDSDFLYLQTDKVWTFTVEEESFPEVSASSPATGEPDVAVGAVITVTFSEDMTTGTFASNFTLTKAAPPFDVVPGVVSVGGPRTLVFTPDDDLEYNVQYTATVTAGVEDLEDSFMQDDYSWSFTTVRLYPEFDEPIAIRNRIDRSNSAALIVVVEPPRGPTDRMSVQVFTPTGRLVRTLIKNVAFGAIPDGGYISWDGTNDNGKALGPGLYFVQIRATSYKRLLKVMIVR